MSISSKSISRHDDWMYLRISSDARHILIYQYKPDSKARLIVCRADEFRLPQSIPYREESKGRLASVFDISPNGRYIAVCHREELAGAPLGNDFMACYIWDSLEKIYLPPFVHQKISGKTYFSNNWEDIFSGYDYLAVRFLPDNDRLITVTVAGEIFVWSIGQQKFLWSMSAATHQANSVAFSNNFGLFVMSEHLGHYRGGQIGLLRTRYDRVYYVKGRSEIFPNPKTTSEVFEEGDFLRLWDIYSGALLREFEANLPVTDLVFSHNDKLIAGTMKDTAFIWDVNTGEVVDALPWYPIISDLTARSHVYQTVPSQVEIEREFDYPIFIKGARQTSQHKKHLSIIENPEQMTKALKAYQEDPILHWQQFVAREYIELRAVSGGSPDTIPPSFEFRSFWWNGRCVAAMPYWFEVPKYQWRSHEMKAALTLGTEAAQRLSIPFLVIDLAQRKDGNWIIIECNDAQESGYASVPPLALWRNILSQT